jgi:hypothetical protein
LQILLSKLVQNHIKDVAAEAVKLQQDDVQTLVDFLDIVRLFIILVLEMLILTDA